MYKLSLLIFIPLLVACVYHDLTAPPTNCKLSGPALELGLVVDATSCSTTDGSILVNARGGEQPYTYLLNNEVQPSNQFINLSAGIYTVGVRDVNGCDSLISNVMVMAQDFSFTATLGEDNQCVSSNGTIRIDVTEGNAPYVYKIDNGAFGDSNEFTTLSHGNHNVVIKDVNDCTIGLNITVPSGITGTSWSTEIKPLIQTYCALSGCHNGLSRPDLRLYSKAKFYAAEIKLFTQDKSMPFDGNLTQNQIEVIACWVDDGALEN